MKILIKLNKKGYNWLVYIDNYLFLTFSLKSKIILKKKNYSKIFFNYFLLLKILRQFGLLKPLKNIKNF